MDQELFTTKEGGPDLALGASLAGKYMTFQLADDVHGFAVLDVREIIGLMGITRVPRAPPFVRGIINLRGKIIPVVDLRLQFGMEACPSTDQTVIIVVQCRVAERMLTMGVLVDQVLEVLSFSADAIEPPPDMGAGSEHAEFVLGVGKVGKRVVFLLDIAKVLSGREASQLARATVQQ
jgi:purine-binding chemotaxis protein CheW